MYDTLEVDIKYPNALVIEIDSRSLCCLYAYGLIGA